LHIANESTSVNPGFLFIQGHWRLFVDAAAKALAAPKARRLARSPGAGLLCANLSARATVSRVQDAALSWLSHRRANNSSLVWPSSASIGRRFLQISSVLSEPDGRPACKGEDPPGSVAGRTLSLSVRSAFLAAAAAAAAAVVAATATAAPATAAVKAAASATASASTGEHLGVDLAQR